MGDLGVYVMFVAVGLIVSLDVAGLTISKATTFQGDYTQRVVWALVNGFWHALLLAVYAFALFGLLRIFTVDFVVIEKFFAAVVRVLNWLKIDFAIDVPLREVLGFVRTHVPVLFGLLTLAIIWQTYDRKIISTPTTGDWRGLPPVARLVYDLVEILVRWTPLRHIGRRHPDHVSAFLRWQAEAALVAVDMLALAVLMVKMGYIETALNKWVLIILVFFIVSGLALLAANWSTRLLDSTPHDDTDAARSLAAAERDWWQIAFRLMEPWFIFYFALELIGFLLFGHPVHSVGFIFGASLLLFALIQKHKMRTIIVAATAPLVSASESTATQISNRSFRDIISDFKRLGYMLLLSIIIFIITVFLIAILWKFAGNLIERPELDAAATGVAGTISLLLLIISVFFRRGYVLAGQGINWLIEHRKVFPFFIGALAVASIVPIYEKISEQGGTVRFMSERDGFCRIVDLGFTANHMHALQISVMFVALWIFSYYLDRRLDLLNKGKEEVTWTELIERSGDIPYHQLDIREVTQVVLLVLVFACVGLMIIQQTIYTTIQPCFELAL